MRGRGGAAAERVSADHPGTTLRGGRGGFERGGGRVGGASRRLYKRFLGPGGRAFFFVPFGARERAHVERSKEEVRMSSAEKFYSDSEVVAAPAVTSAAAPVAVRTAELVGYEGRGALVYEPVGDVDATFAALKDQRATPVERAHGILAVLRRMVRAETGVVNLSAGLSPLLDALWSGPTIAALARSIFQRTTALAHGRSVEAGHQEQLVRDLHDFVEWYTLRKASLASCRHEGFAEADPDCLFNVRVSRDVERWGVPGLTVDCGLRFIARAGETLWFKVTARRGAEYVRAHPAWCSWSDESAGPSDGGDGSMAPGRFATFVPIRPLHQRTCIDTVSVFVPYGALDLPAERLELELEAGVYTQSGELVVSVAIPEMVHGGGRRPLGLVAPQSLGVWERNPVSGDEISAVSAHVRLEGEPGWEESVIEARCDVVLVGFVGQRLEVEVRLRRPDGTLVEPLDDGSAGLVEPPVGRVSVLPRQPFARFFGLRAVVPVGALGLEPGRHALLAEVVVCGADGGLVCGTLVPLEVRVSGSGARVRSDAGSVPVPAPAIDGDIAVGALTVAPWVHNGNVALAVDLPVAAHDWSAALYRFEVALECLGGVPITNVGAGDRPVVRSVWFGGERDRPAGSSQIVRAVFDGREFGRFLKTVPAAERTIVARVGLVSPEGEKIFETTGSIAGDFVAEVKAALPVERPLGPVQVVSLEPTYDTVGESALRFELVLNVDRAAVPRQRCAVYYELLDEAGKPIAVYQDGEALVGAVVMLDLPFIGGATVRRWYQTHVVFGCSVAALGGVVPHGVKLTTFSPQGEYLETIQASFTPGTASLLKTRSRAARHGGAGGAAASTAGSSGSSNEGSSGFLSRVRSALIG